MFDVSCECAGLPPRCFQPGETILPEGGRSGALFFLKEGEVEIRREKVVLGTLKAPGTVLGEVSILLDRPHVAEVRALTRCELLVAEEAERFLAAHPKVGLYIARSLAWKVDAMACYLADLKQQYADRDDHLGMVHEVLDSLIQTKP